MKQKSVQRGTRTLKYGDVHLPKHISAWKTEMLLIRKNRIFVPLKNSDWRVEARGTVFYVGKCKYLYNALCFFYGFLN